MEKPKLQRAHKRRATRLDYVALRAHFEKHGQVEKPPPTGVVEPQSFDRYRGFFKKKYQPLFSVDSFVDDEKEEPQDVAQHQSIARQLLNTLTLQIGQWIAALKASQKSEAKPPKDEDLEDLLSTKRPRAHS